MIELDKLARVRIFNDLPQDRLEWLRDRMTESSVSAGDVLMREGEMATRLTILLEGELNATRSAEGRHTVERYFVPEAFGTPCLIASIPYPVTLTAMSAGRIAHLPEAAFHELFVSCGPFSRAVARVMTDWLTALETAALNRSRLAALGKLAAGLAHEMNNPASALTRALDYVRQDLAGLEASALALGQHAVPKETIDRLAAVAAGEASIERARTANPLRQSERESRLAEWLAARRVMKPWRVAPVLAAHGVEPDVLARFAGELSPEQLDASIGWIARMLDLRSVLDDAMQGAQRISDIVAAMKSYSFMDQGPQQEIDLHDGIDNTLMVMMHETKRGIAVIREYDRSVPRIQAYGSELNQVWTRIIENAIEAMNGHGDIVIRTSRDGDDAVVEIADSGPGIPPDAAQHLFEPFYTSKYTLHTQGPSLGLGLHIAYRIVVNRHGGTIGVRSGAGGTVFRVTLPLAGAHDEAQVNARLAGPVL
ncbi:integral membrane sensor signal transduction histidine kinase [Caballeronia hypogeia]|uniref:histidine kinase n=1 Tax=Caballeronia hypogeia TaxID=1777140 RepID=A0A158CQT6_9BURK|nr:ATP-binding protein [Caballeronia hypogeia]SAK84688.1 integral membrane sensor signal transduction histidine kinase [Caballeronia hypogeia]